MSKVNPGIRLLSCGCLLNTTIQADGSGRVDFSPCSGTCPNYRYIMAYAQNTAMTVEHKGLKNND
jgi:hypothetical protein